VRAFAESNYLSKSLNESLVLKIMKTQEKEMTLQVLLTICTIWARQGYFNSDVVTRMINVFTKDL
jgi:hypothetical protein